MLAYYKEKKLSKIGSETEDKISSATEDKISSATEDKISSETEDKISRKKGKKRKRPTALKLHNLLRISSGDFTPKNRTRLSCKRKFTTHSKLGGEPRGHCTVQSPTPVPENI